MSLRLKVLYSSLTGAWGALLAWTVLDPWLGIRPTNPYLDALVNGALLGLLIGGLIGGFGGLLERRFWRLLRGLLAGAVAGLAGGILGLLTGEVLFQSLGRGTLLRSLGWAIFGVGIGVGEGLLTRSWRRALYGAGGGIVGGVLGSVAFMGIRALMTMRATSRALGFVILGACIGLFVGLVPTIFKRAWLKVITSGRNEGKELILDKDVVLVGRNDALDFPLYGDRSIAPRQAEIRREQSRFVLRRLAEGPLAVNGQQVAQPVMLQDGCQISVGHEVVLFQQNER